MKEDSVNVFNYVKQHEDENITAKDIAAALDLDPRKVNGIITAAFQRHRDEEKNIVPLMQRVEAEVKDPETGFHKQVKFIQLTDEGRVFDPEA